jgi:methionine synthase I (cobalamin-dependent)
LEKEGKKGYYAKLVQAKGKVEDYVKYIPQMIKNGANIIGGCCGTDPGYIKRMAEIIKPTL